MAYTDAVTDERIELAWLRAAIAPVGAFGRRHDDATPLYRPGDEVRARTDIEDLVALALRLDRDGVARLRAALRAVPEVTPIVTRARVGDSLSDVDFYELGRFVDALTGLRQAWDTAGGAHGRRPPELDILRATLAPGRDGTGFYLADAFEPRLCAARAALSGLEAALATRREAIAARVRDSTGIDPVGDEFVVLRDVYDGPLPDGVHIIRDTPIYRTVTIVVESVERDAALAYLSEVEEVGRRALAEAVSREAGVVAAAMQALGLLDHTLARVAFVQRWGGCVPEFVTDRVAFSDATFVPLAKALAARGHSYTPLSIDLRSVAVLTGPNMGGKSAALSTTGFLCACVALGLPPPAKSAAIPLLDVIVWLGGEGPADRTRLLSSFAAEVVRARDILAVASSRTLVLVDEFARTTGPSEGRALLIAFVEALRDRGALALVASHFDGVAAAGAVSHYHVAGLMADGAFAAIPSENIDAALDAISAAMDYHIVPAAGIARRSDAVELARLLGFPISLVERARRML